LIKLLLPYKDNQK